MTCQKAQGFLGPADVEVKQTVDANKTRIGSDEALALLDGIDKFIAMKGPRVNVFDLKKSRPADEDLLDHLMGPTGNLRAPTARIGKMLLVGFNEETYRKFLG
jgi:arsenate reductase-like glutaredoxin family protein